MQAEAAAGGEEDAAVVERVAKFGQAVIAATSGGASGGTPGLATTSAARAIRPMSCPPVCTFTPSRRNSAAVDSSSVESPASDAYTSAPVRASNCAAARPLRAKPTLAISPVSHFLGIAGLDSRAMISEA